MYTTIKTSQRSFVTDPERWMGQSLYFSNLLSVKWGDKQKDNSYFFETNADVFEQSFSIFVPEFFQSPMI
jgi:hypothetical protein